MTNSIPSSNWRSMVSRSSPCTAIPRFQTTEGPALDMGAFIVGLEAAAGIEIPLVGKPAPEFFRAALLELGSETDEVMILGDDIDSDVRGGQALGMTGVLVATGKYRPSDLETEGPAPDQIDREYPAIA